jgi:deoxyribodipyrimidine photo-lyase
VSTAVVVFTRDLRVHDNPALYAATAAGGEVVPVFVLDRAITAKDYNRPNRAKFLAESLADLDRSLRRLGGRLIVRTGDVAEQVAAVAADAQADTVHLARDYTRYARRREAALAERLGDRCRLHLHDCHVVLAPEAVTPSAGGHYTVFTPYHRAWLQTAHRDLLPAPGRLRTPTGVRGDDLPTQADICPGQTSPELVPGGETEARRRADAWYADGVAAYPDDHDALARDNTSRLSAYLHFGCISPLELVARADRRKRGTGEFVRQICWRDFYHQVLARRPEVVDDDYRTQGDRWSRDDEAFRTWADGRTGYPIVDAGMRQLRREGWMHNRARLLTGSFLTKHLYVDWRWGARHFFDLLVDGDIVNNTMNWQWIAGTGTDSRPNRMLNPTLQAQRYDPDGDYVRRYVEELRDVPGGAVHEPWRLAGDDRPAGARDYPDPIVDHKEAFRAFRAHRSKD